jgi:NADH-quinone oxidoreductase subunit N
MLAYRYTPRLDNKDETLYALVLFAVLGMCMLDSAANLLTAFLGLELLAVPLFGLIAWQPQRRGAVEGGIKYGVLAGVAAAFFAYGVALFYVDSGTLTLSQGQLPPGGVAPDAILLLSSSLLLVAVGFELAIVPFHMWAPDIYQAAPAPVTTLLGSVAKMAVLAFLIRLFGQQLPQVWSFFIPLLYALALASMIVGNLLALRQQNIKRLLAYSAIAHIGYILVAMTGGSEESIKAAIYYTIAYAVTSVTVFAVVTALALEGGDRESLQAWQGLGRRYPVCGLIMTLGLLSLAGIPPTVGFFAKLLAFTAALAAGHTVLVVVAVLTTAVSFYYYLRVVVVMFKPGEAPAGQPVGWGIGITLAASAVLTLGLGVFAEPLLQLAAF